MEGRLRWAACLLVAVLAGCTNPDGGVESDDPQTTDGTDDTDTDRVVPPGTQFVDVALQAGFVHRQWSVTGDYYPPCRGIETHAGSASIADYDGDGLDDVFFTVFDGRSPLYRNRGDGTFEEVSAQAELNIGGFPSAAAWGDVDGDGDPDLVVAYTHQGWLTLHLNQGDGTFLDGTDTWGLTAPDGAQTCPSNWGLSFADPDLDGDLDLFMGSYGVASITEAIPTPKTYFQNIGDRFIDATAASGLDAGQEIFAFGAAWGDLNADGRLDLALSGDFLTNQLYVAQPDGTFQETGSAAGIADIENAMGGVLVDIDEDGDLDWLQTAIFDGREDPPGVWGQSGNRIYLNNGQAQFTDVSESWGLRQGGWAWGLSAFDIDNDADLDVGWTNGHFMGDGGAHLIGPFLTDPTTLWLRQGPTAFTERAYELGIDHTAQGRGYVPWDYDNDGDLDILIVEWAGAPKLYENRMTDLGHWLTIRAQRPTGNRAGIGATVWVQRTPDDPARRRELSASPSYLSQPPVEAHFGLGDHDAPVHRVRIVWPEGHETVLTDVPIDRVEIVQD